MHNNTPYCVRTTLSNNISRGGGGGGGGDGDGKDNKATTRFGTDYDTT